MENLEEVFEKWLEERDKIQDEKSSEWSYEDVFEAFRAGINHGINLIKE